MMPKTKKQTEGQPQVGTTAVLADGGPAILDDMEAWCESCQSIKYINAPWQDVCTCSAEITRSFYDDANEQRRAAAGLPLLHG